MPQLQNNPLHKGEKTIATFIADYGKGWNFTSADLQIAHFTHNQERQFLGIDKPITHIDQLFPVFQFSMLSAAQDTPNLIRIIEELRKKKLHTPTACSNPYNMTRVFNILKLSRYPNQKFPRLYKLAEWWQKSDSQKLLTLLMHNGNNKTYMPALRDKLVKYHPPGMSLKTITFVTQLCYPEPKDITNVVIDKWVIEFLRDIGHNVVPPDYRTVSGFQPKEYLKFERILINMASQLKLSPSQLGLMIWCKKAYNEPNKSLLDYGCQPINRRKIQCQTTLTI